MSLVGRETDGGRGESHESTVGFSWDGARGRVTWRASRNRPGNDEGRPGGRPIWLAAEIQLLLAGQLHPEARRAKDRPCGS